MVMRLSALTLLLVWMLAICIGCSNGSTPAESDATGSAAAAAPVEAADEAPRSARTLPMPGSGSSGSGGEQELLHWEVPDGWTSEQPASSMRLAQYRVPGDAGNGLCIVFYFGPGQGGDPMANAVRWAGQFEQPGGGSSVDVMQVTALEGAQLPVQLVEVTGTYDGGMTMTDAPPEKQPGHMLLGAIVEGPDAPWFFKFTGPEATVLAQRDAFVGMMSSIHPGH